MTVANGKIQLRTPVPQDAHNELKWDLDEELNALDPRAGSTFNQKKFSIYTIDDKHIGACMLYNLDAHGIQLGIRIGDHDYLSKGYGTDAVNAMINWCITMTNVRRIWLKLLPENIRAIKCYEKCGFLVCGTLELNGYLFTIMEVYIR